MTQLITITEHKGSKAVSARELHQFLENKREFATWIKHRISEYGFIENQDFEVFDEFVKNSQGGRPTIEYIISLDMAKELSMVERNDKGKQARQYFIACEKKLIDGRKTLETSSREQVAHQKVELLELIKKNLFRGDLMYISLDKELSHNCLRACLCGKLNSKRYLAALYEKALENKQKKHEELGKMINQLKD